MRRSLWKKRGRADGGGMRFIGALLVGVGLIILWRLLPVWLLWGLAAAVLVAIGLALVLG